MPYGIVGKRKPPKSSLEARRKYGEGKMYEQCFSIELKPWRKPFDKKEEGGRGNPPARAAKRPEKMNEMYEQCFPMEPNTKP